MLDITNLGTKHFELHRRKKLNLTNRFFFSYFEKGGLYTSSTSLRELFASIKKVNINTLRSIDVKRIIEEFSGIQSEYVLTADENILPDAINAILTGERITNYMQLKAVTYSISSDIESRKKIPWPPTSLNILESDELLRLDKRVFNLIAWIVSRSAAIGKNGFVQLS